MKTIWMAGFAVMAASAMAQTTIYKHVDANGRVTYSNKPMKDASVVELEPLTTIPATPMGTLQARPNAPVAVASAGTSAVDTNGNANAASRDEIKPAVATLAPRSTVASVSPASFPSIDTQTQKRRDEGRRKILEEELSREEQSLAEMRKNILSEQQNPTLVAAVRLAQLTAEPTPAQQLEMRQSIDKASGRIRGLQATVAEHVKNIEALKKELGALK